MPTGPGKLEPQETYVSFRLLDTASVNGHVESLQLEIAAIENLATSLRKKIRNTDLIRRGKYGIPIFLGLEFLTIVLQYPKPGLVSILNILIADMSSRIATTIESIMIPESEEVTREKNQIIEFETSLANLKAQLADYNAQL